MSAVDNRRVEYRNSFSPGGSPAAKLACWQKPNKNHKRLLLRTAPGGTGVRENPLPSKVMVAERLGPFFSICTGYLSDIYTRTVGNSVGSVMGSVAAPWTLIVELLIRNARLEPRNKKAICLRSDHN